METENPRSPDVFGYNAKWGYYLDRETELYVTQHRMYDASTGRFLNRDPIGYAGGVNLYGYCGQGPVGSADPNGLSKMRQDGGPIADGDEIEPTWDEIAAHGFMTSWAMLGSFVSDAAAELANQGFKLSLGILGPFVDGPFSGWDGGEYANEPGAAESRTAWAVAASCSGGKGGLSRFVKRGGKGVIPLGGAGSLEVRYPYPTTGGGGLKLKDASGGQLGRIELHLEPDKPWWQAPHIHQRPGIGKRRPWDAPIVWPKVFPFQK